MDDSPDYLVIDYTPMAAADVGNGILREVKEYQAQFRTARHGLPTQLQNKLSRLGEYALGTLAVPELDLGDVIARGKVQPYYYQVQIRRGQYSLHLAYRVSGGLSECDVPITEATRRLIDNIWPMCEQLAWNHFRERLAAPIAEPSSKRKVYLSYRKGPSDRRRFVEAIAHRLGREGFLPWYDEWEILAGDSLPREMADGLTDAYAFVTILTTDYPGGRWAREELENAITQRVERDIKIVPVLSEPCERPALLQPLRYVDCTAHAPDLFERQFLDIIDSLNEIELNPYRR